METVVWINRKDESHHIWFGRTALWLKISALRYITQYLLVALRQEFEGYRTSWMHQRLLVGYRIMKFVSSSSIYSLLWLTLDPYLGTSEDC